MFMQRQNPMLKDILIRQAAENRQAATGQPSPFADPYSADAHAEGAPPPPYLQNLENVPGTGGGFQAPQLPEPAPIDDQLEQGDGGDGSVDPITQGANTASSLVRSSDFEDDDQRRRAMGHALMQFASSYAGSQNPSTLGAINEAMSPAQAAFISERDKAVKKSSEAAKIARDEAYRKETLDISKKEHERKVKRDEDGNLSPYHREKLENDLINRTVIFEEKKAKALERYEKSIKFKGKEEKAELLEKKSAELDKRFAAPLKAIADKAKAAGIDLSSFPSDTPGDAPIDIASIPRNPDGSFDTSKLTPEQKAAILQQ